METTTRQTYSESFDEAFFRVSAKAGCLRGNALNTNVFVLSLIALVSAINLEKTVVSRWNQVQFNVSIVMRKACSSMERKARACCRGLLSALSSITVKFPCFEGCQSEGILVSVYRANIITTHFMAPLRTLTNSLAQRKYWILASIINLNAVYHMISGRQVTGPTTEQYYSYVVPERLFLMFFYPAKSGEDGLLVRAYRTELLGSSTI
ncbi:hypothetical protein IW261DRAFT_1426600 [Armillaria novae-zelandiae]|uniref:Uncharacterized protein n=1 Tax=Armillaria novae-zelandiae TaxID=153914 RepID=A0AA39TQY6_9AGAR|nr:hypothetical protein IW261DRAFT_1426600 [Armillaria novae-zelandiae]